MPGGSDEKESSTAVNGHCTVKVCDIPGNETRAQLVNRSTVVGHSQTPDSGVVLSPLDKRSAAAQSPSNNPELVSPAGPSGLEYRIAQTPTGSTIVIIRGGSQQGLSTTPSTSSPVRDDQMPLTVPPSAVQPVTTTAPTTSRQPTNASAATSKFVVSDRTTTTAAPYVAGGSGYQSFPSPSSDEKTVVRLSSAESEQRRYVISAGTLKSVEPSASKLRPPAHNSDQTTSHSVERKTTEVSPSRRRKDVKLNVGSGQAVTPRPLDPAKTPAVAGRIITPPKPKASLSEQRDAKQRQLKIQKRQNGQRLKPPQVKQSEKRALRAPVKASHSGNKRQDVRLEVTQPEDSQTVKKSFAELRAMFQSADKPI